MCNNDTNLFVDVCGLRNKQNGAQLSPTVHKYPGNNDHCTWIVELLRLEAGERV